MCPFTTPLASYPKKLALFPSECNFSWLATSGLYAGLDISVPEEQMFSLLSHLCYGKSREDRSLKSLKTFLPVGTKSWLENASKREKEREALKKKLIYL